MAVQGGAHVVRRIRPLHAGVETFRSLPEYCGINEGLVVAAICFLADVVQRVPGEPDARAHADIEIELLPHRHNGRVIDIAFALHFRLEFSLRGFVRLRCDGSEETELVLRE